MYPYCPKLVVLTLSPQLGALTSLFTYLYHHQTYVWLLNQAEFNVFTCDLDTPDNDENGNVAVPHEQAYVDLVGIVGWIPPPDGKTTP